MTYIIAIITAIINLFTAKTEAPQTVTLEDITGKSFKNIYDAMAYVNSSVGDVHNRVKNIIYRDMITDNLETGQYDVNYSPQSLKVMANHIDAKLWETAI